MGPTIQATTTFTSSNSNSNSPNTRSLDSPTVTAEMILSPYRNPPYRSPTPNTSTTSPPPANPSPKRKRSESVGQQPSEALRIQTNLREDLEDPVSGCDSPRSKVAEKFRELDIDRPVTLEGEAGGDEAKVKRKRLKGNPRFYRPSPSPINERVVAETPATKQRDAEIPLPDGQIEIQETPQLVRQHSSSPSESEEALDNFRNAFRSSKQPVFDAKIMLSPEATPLPPSPRVMISPPQPRDPIPDRALSPLQLNDDLSLDQAALTWQDSEITGHEIDSSLGDDGLGINGIGFRPTPAMAYARSQKRKQQVSEWKAREARDARQRRMERRRGGSGGDGGGGGSGVRRVVRFEEVG